MPVRQAAPRSSESLGATRNVLICPQGKALLERVKCRGEPIGPRRAGAETLTLVDLGKLRDRRNDRKAPNRISTYMA
jgi:hypothetical protein